MRMAWFLQGVFMQTIRKTTQKYTQKTTQRLIKKTNGRFITVSLTLLLLAAAGAFTACDQMQKMFDVVGEAIDNTFNALGLDGGDEDAGKPAPSTPPSGGADTQSIKAKFGITTTQTTGVTDTFNALHQYIQTGWLTNQSNVIRLGDYIDLEGGLTVDGTSLSNTALSQGALLRLIVVGINSFNGKNGNNTPHVVFQFQNIPVMYHMENSYANTKGYAGSEMRAYLTPVAGVNESGKFLAGLIAAGVPQKVLWQPVRYVAKKGKGANGVNKLEDPLWLPTERELFNENLYSRPAWESPVNQAWLEYYHSADRRIKYDATNSPQSYWEASADDTTTDAFGSVSNKGLRSVGPANSSRGAAPAFCVK
jgi:hypothetical protein